MPTTYDVSNDSDGNLFASNNYDELDSTAENTHAA